MSTQKEQKTHIKTQAEVKADKRAEALRNNLKKRKVLAQEKTAQEKDQREKSNNDKS